MVLLKMRQVVLLATDPGFQSVHALSTGNFRAFQLYINTKVEIEPWFWSRFVEKSIQR
jgi:hypothetical protein